MKVLINRLNKYAMFSIYVVVIFLENAVYLNCIKRRGRRKKKKKESAAALALRGVLASLYCAQDDDLLRMITVVVKSS
jgi:uncharacterized membrane protein YjfL (UPF0719 family)